MKRKLPDDKITAWLMQNGFAQYHGQEDYDCVMRVHVLHYLLWSSTMKHFSIAMLNEKGGPGGHTKKWNAIMLPKTIYTVQEAKNLIESISTHSELILCHS